jgi:alpha-glucosidase
LAANRVESPDGNVVVEFLLRSGGVPAYQIDYLGKPMILESRLGFDPAGTNDFQIIATATNAHHGQWTQIYGERKVVPDNYRELSIDLNQPAGRGRCLALHIPGAGRSRSLHQHRRAH